MTKPVVNAPLHGASTGSGVGGGGRERSPRGGRRLGNKHSPPVAVSKAQRRGRFATPPSRGSIQPSSHSGAILVGPVQASGASSLLASPSARTRLAPLTLSRSGPPARPGLPGPRPGVPKRVGGTGGGGWSAAAAGRQNAGPVQGRPSGPLEAPGAAFDRRPNGLTPIQTSPAATHAASGSTAQNTRTSDDRQRRGWKRVGPA
jgi:hypothetical protein